MVKKSAENLKLFVENFRVCPICGHLNNVRYLVEFFYSENVLKENLTISLLLKLNFREFNNVWNLGVPCHNCWNEIHHSRLNGLIEIYMMKNAISKDNYNDILELLENGEESDKNDHKEDKLVLVDDSGRRMDLGSIFDDLFNLERED